MPQEVPMRCTRPLQGVPETETKGLGEWSHGLVLGWRGWQAVVLGLGGIETDW